MTTYRRKSANRGAGFTLVEILVVIVIIGLLAGMTTTVLVGARRSARGSVVAAQMSQLSTALDEYKNRYGEYPPDFSDPTAVERHLKKRWPRYSVDYNTFLDQVKLGCRMSSAVVPTKALDGRQIWDVGSGGYLSALIFWLGGLPDADGKPSGFYANPKAPLGYYADGTTIRVSKALRDKPLYDFALKNVGSFLAGGSGSNVYYYRADGDACYDNSLNAYVYIPAFVQANLPIVYFRPTANSSYENMGARFAETTNSDDGVAVARPYARTRDGNVYTFYETKRFQLVHPGVDGYFGPDENTESRGGIPVLAGKENLYLEDADNIVNFATNGTLESEYANENE